MTLRLRLASAGSAAFGLMVVLAIVGALFPAVGHTFGKLNLPRGVSELLGGANYATITGWFDSEIGSVYGPLLMGAVAITAAAATTAGEEEDRILALVLSHPITRARLVAAKAVAIAILVVIIAVASWAGLLAGVALAGGGIGVGHITAFSVHLACFGFAIGAVALAVGAGTGRRTLTTGWRRRWASSVGSSTGSPPSSERSRGSSTCRCFTITPATTRSRRASTSWTSWCWAWWPSCWPRWPAPASTRRDLRG